MNIDDLVKSLEQIKTLTSSLEGKGSSSDSLNTMLGCKAIIRTYSAGVWFGTVSEKAGDEVIITQARRLWRWHAAKSISLSAVALHGLKESESKVVEAVPQVWLKAIEIIPCSQISIKSIEWCKNVKTQ